MFRRAHPIITALAALCLLGAAPHAGAESGFAPAGGKASASLNFRIIIPPVMRVLENSHPDRVAFDEGGRLGAQQRLVMLSNMKGGFCVTLRQTDPHLIGWRLQTAPESGVSLSPVADGYRLCTARAGRYTLVLEHQFDTSQSATTAALRWPVQTDLMAM